MGRLLGKAITWILVGVVVIGAITAIVLVKQSNDDAKALPKPQTVVDEQSGITWEMHGKPTLVESTSDIGKGTGPGSEIDVRTYTVDHGDWVERVKIFDVPPSEVDFAPAMLATFGAEPTAKLGKVDYVQVDGFNAASARVPGYLKRDGKQVTASTRVFATQMHNYMVSGGVAVPVPGGSSSIDVRAQQEQLRSSMHEA